MTRQQTTNPDIDRWELTPQQQAAVDLLAAGTSVTELCVYDNLSASPRLQMDGTALAGAICGGAPCWQRAGIAGWAYRDASLAPSGIAMIKLKAGLDGRTQIKIKG